MAQQPPKPIPKPVAKPGIRNAPTTEKDDSNTGFNAIIALVAIVCTLLVVLIGGGIFWVMRSGSKPAEQVAVAPSLPSTPVATKAPVVTPEPATEAPKTEPTAEQPGQVAAPAAAEPEKAAATAPAENSSELTRVDVDPRLVVYRLPSPTYAMAYDNATGHIALIDDKRGGIAIYEVDDLLAGKVEPKQVVKTEGEVTAITLKPFDKRRYFAFATKQASAIKLLDADALAPAGDLSVRDTYRVGYLIAGSSPRDPYLGYVFYGRTNNLPIDNSEKKRSGRIDLRTMKEDDSFTTLVNEHEYVSDGAVSADGSMFYYRGSGRVTMEWQAASYSSFPNGRVLDEHDEANEYISDAYGNAVSQGTKLYPRDMRGEPRALEFEPRAYFHAQPIVVGLKGNDLVLGSSNNYRELASVPMPAELTRARNFQEDWYTRQQRLEAEGPGDFRQRGNLSFLSEPKFLAAAADDGRKTAIVVFESAIVLVQLDKFQLPAEPSLVMQTVPAFNQYVDELVSIPLEIGSPNATFEVVAFSAQGNAPVVEGKTLKWTPTAEQVAVQRVKMRARDGETTYEWEWPFRVQQRSLSIPFPVTGVSIEPRQRKQAVIWGYTEKYLGDKKYDREHYLGVVDLATHQLTAQRKLSRPVATAAIGSNAVYAIAAAEFDEQNHRPQKGKQLGVLRLPDLQPANHTEFPDDASQCAVIADKFLVASGSGVWRYTLPDLKALEEPTKGVRMAADYQRTREGWLWEGVYYDDDFKNPQLLSTPVYFGTFRERIDQMNETPTKPWELPGRLEFDGGPKLSLKPLNRDGGTAVAEPHVIRLLPPIGVDRETDSHDSTPPQSIDYGNEVIAAIYKGRLFIIPFNHFQLNSKVPVHFEPAQSTMVLNPAKPTKVDYIAKGARSYTLELRMTPNSTTPLFTDSSKDGSFTIDVRKFGERLVSDAVTAAVGESWERNDIGGKDKQLDKLQDYVKSTSKSFREIAKHNPKGVPVLLYASVKADADGQPSATLHHEYLMEIPLALVRDSLEVGAKRSR